MANSESHVGGEGSEPVFGCYVTCTGCDRTFVKRTDDEDERCWKCTKGHESVEFKRTLRASYLTSFMRTCGTGQEDLTARLDNLMRELATEIEAIERKHGKGERLTKEQKRQRRIARRENEAK